MDKATNLFGDEDASNDLSFIKESDWPDYKGKRKTNHPYLLDFRDISAFPLPRHFAHTCFKSTSLTSKNDVHLSAYARFKRTERFSAYTKGDPAYAGKKKRKENL